MFTGQHIAQQTIEVLLILPNPTLSYFCKYPSYLCPPLAKSTVAYLCYHGGFQHLQHLLFCFLLHTPFVCTFFPSGFLVSLNGCHFLAHVHCQVLTCPPLGHLDQYSSSHRINHPNLECSSARSGYPRTSVKRCSATLFDTRCSLLPFGSGATSLSCTGCLVPKSSTVSNKS